MEEKGKRQWKGCKRNKNKKGRVHKKTNKKKTREEKKEQQEKDEEQEYKKVVLNSRRADKNPTGGFLLSHYFHTQKGREEKYMTQEVGEEQKKERWIDSFVLLLHCGYVWQAHSIKCDILSS